MSSAPNLSKQVISFIKECVPIVEALQVLLALHRDASKVWTLEDLARETRVSGFVAADCIRIFRSHGLIAGPESGFHYGPVKAELAQTVDALAQAYVERPVSVIRAIYAPPSNVQALADAFRLKE